MSTHAQPARRRVAATAAAAVAALALMGLGASSASAAVTARITPAGVLQVIGDGSANKILVEPDPSNTSLLVDVGEDGTIDFAFAFGTFSSVDVQGRDGVDELRAASALTMPVTLDGGAGNDTLIGGSGDDVLLGGTGNDFVDGSRGNDTALLGGGDDHFQWDPGDGSDIVEGQGGADEFDFNGANINENLAVVANGQRVRFTRDIANVTTDLNGVERLAMHTLGGADNVTVGDLTGTSMTKVNVDLSATGGGDDGAADTVTDQGTNGPDAVSVSTAGGQVVVSGLAAQLSVAGAQAGDTVGTATMGAADTITGGVALATPAAVAVDGGADADQVVYQGSAAADNIGIASNGGAVATFTSAGALMDSTNVENLLVQGLGGADTITGQNGIGTLTQLTIDGGSGDDVLRGGDGADTLIGGSGNDFVAGGIGNDLALLGDGNDHFSWNPGDASDTVEGQGGSDEFDFNGANINENLAVSANGSRVRFTRDVANVTTDLGGVERLALRTLGGADTVTVGDLTGTDATDVGVDLTGSDGNGDGAVDTVTALGTPGPDAVNVGSTGGEAVVSGLAARLHVRGAEAGSDHVGVATGAGDDAITSGVGFLGPAIADVDGGADTDTVTYTGTGAPDTIGIAPNGTAVALFTPTGGLVNASGLEHTLVQGLGGADVITGQNGIGALTQLTIDGGDGADQLRGGDGADTLIGGSGSDVVAGGIGNDVALLGTGNDHFVWNPGDASDTVEGQGGTDELDFNGANINEHFTVSANGSRVRFTRDVANVTTDLGGVEQLALRTLGGADTVDVGDLTGTALKLAAIDLSGFGGGDGAADTVNVFGTAGPDTVHVTTLGSQVLTSGLAAKTTIVGSEPASDALHVSTLAGTDSVTVDPSVPSLIQPIVDLGPQ